MSSEPDYDWSIVVPGFPADDAKTPPAGWYEMHCPRCGVKFTPIEWNHHRPECPHAGSPLKAGQDRAGGSSP